MNLFFSNDHEPTMNFKNRYLILLLAASIFISCNHYDAIQKEVRESSANDDESHKEGEDCMSCHHDNGNEASEEGKWWYFAGTAYNSNGTIAKSGGRVELWTNYDTVAHVVSGEKLYSVSVDKKGNFYTSKIIDFKGGFYVRLVSNSNLDTTMSTKITIGNTSCNSCHGNNYDGRNQPHLKFK